MQAEKEQTGTMQLSLPSEVVAGLEKEARRKRRSVAAVLADYLEYLEDLRDVRAAKKAGGRSYTLAEVEKRLGL